MTSPYKGALLFLLVVALVPSASAEIPFWTYSLQDSLVILPATEEETPAAEFTMQYLHPVGGTDTAILAKLRRQSAISFFGRAVDSPSAALTEERDSWFAEYESACEDYDSTIGTFAYRWSVESRMSIRLNDPDLLVLENAEYLYTGGAHGVYGSVFTVLDPRSGDSVGLEHIFPPASLRKLGPLIEKKILQELARRLGEDVSREELLTEHVEPTSITCTKWRPTRPVNSICCCHFQKSRG